MRCRWLLLKYAEPSGDGAPYERIILPRKCYIERSTSAGYKLGWQFCKSWERHDDSLPIRLSVVEFFLLGHISSPNKILVQASYILYYDNLHNTYVNWSKLAVVYHNYNVDGLRDIFLWRNCCMQVHINAD
jgi:hypothetical protein